MSDNKQKVNNNKESGGVTGNDYTNPKVLFLLSYC